MKKLSIILNKYFYFILFLMMIIGFTANYQGTAMGGVLRFYIDYARLIKSGFTINIEYPTIPMWGYGFIYAVTDNKLLIIILQFCITIFTIYMLDQLAQQIFKTDKAKIFFRLFLLISFPWFSFNSILWPYSIAANFIIISLIFLYKYFNSHKFIFLFVSACSFGIALNFRSDYYLYPLFLVGLLIGYKLFTRKNKSLIKIKVHHILIWVILIYSFLIPYAIYTKATIGHYLITSTNSGHMLFVGLGQLPNNKWGITPSDEDPKITSIIKEELGLDNNYRYYSLKYQGDQVLKKRFLNMIKKDPIEYLKKDLYSIYTMLTGGFYWGEYYNWVVPDRNKVRDVFYSCRELFKKMNFKDIFKLIQKEGLFSPLFIIQAIITIYSVFLFLFFNLLLFLFLFKRLYRLNYLISTIFLSIIFYQYTICVFVHYSRGYITNLYLIYIFIINWIIDYYIEKKDNQYNITCVTKYN